METGKTLKSERDPYVIKKIKEGRKEGQKIKTRKENDEMKKELRKNQLQRE